MDGVTEETLESLRKENKTFRSKIRSLERSLAESERLMSLVTDNSRNILQTSQVMQKEIVQREKYLSMLLDNCRDFFILLNEKQEIAYCSRNFVELMRQGGFTEIQGRDYLALLMEFAGASHRENAVHRLETIHSGKAVAESLEEIDFRRDGKARNYMVSAAPMYGENRDFSGVLVCYSDVTELVEAREAAEQSSRAKSAFLARMSHEIRTPMNAIIGLSKLALREELPPKIRSYCADVNSAATNLLGIINDILDFSKIESGKMEIVNAEYYLASMINDVTSIARTRLADSAVRFVVRIGENIPGKMIGDEIRIRQILLNLLSNAVKYTPQGQITFSIQAELGDGGNLTLIAEIIDTGIGIKEEDLGKLFGDFTRFDLKKNFNVEGTGLGLAISMSLCRAMGGDITVKSEYGKGSVFRAAIPQKAEDFTPFTPGVVEAAGPGRGNDSAAVRFTVPEARLLIVDDISMNLRVAEGLLSPYEAHLDTALSGREALEMAKLYEYDIIFMDHMMPEMDGVETTALIRSWERERNAQNIGTRVQAVPIVALTANAMSGMREFFLSKEFNDYLSKPIEIEKLGEILSKWIPRRKIRKSAGSPPKAAPAAASLVIPGLDTAKGLVMTGGSPEGYRGVLAVFRKDVEERMVLLRSEPAEKDLPFLTTQTHALKSALASIGAAELSALAVGFEAAGKAGNLAFLREGLPGFADRLTLLSAGIHEALEQSAAPRMEADPSAPLVPLGALAGQLAAALRSGDAEETDRALEELSQKEADAETREILEQISDDVLMAEYDKALETLIRHFKI